MKAQRYHHLEICDECSGAGTTAAHLGDVTDAIAEDPDFGEAYSDGQYDRACSCCKGTGRVEVLSAGAPWAVRRAYAEARRLARWESEWAAEAAAERRAGA